MRLVFSRATITLSLEVARQDLLLPTVSPRTQVRAESLHSYRYALTTCQKSLSLLLRQETCKSTASIIQLLLSLTFPFEFSDQAEDFIELPGLSGGAVGTKYDWNTTYIATADVNNRAVSIPQGKVVGGSTLLNRMLQHRGSAHDYDRWEALGNEGWSWSGLLPFFKKVNESLNRIVPALLIRSQSEIFSPPNEDIAAQYNITYDSSAHGTDGRIHASYSPWFWPSTGK